MSNNYNGYEGGCIGLLARFSVVIVGLTSAIFIVGYTLLLLEVL